MQERFNIMKNNLQDFRVIYDSKFRQDISKDILLRHCKDLEIILIDKEDSDINGSELFEEFALMRDSFALEFNKSPAAPKLSQNCGWASLTTRSQAARAFGARICSSPLIHSV
ncbi:hypothetical protein Fcan01_22195 [Folsomia candida]|uniref:Uncharacterized protein n=1 Tax=Folsomia candida TaxID=158441 RepID=A0A226DEX1_FOLCA|nr:hypothetical protein Fcan01_22195 [Folsomia candida]